MNDDNDRDIIQYINLNNQSTCTENNNFVVGIDLGTTNSCIAIWRNNNVEIIPDEFGNKTLPSVVSYTNKSMYIGESAKQQKDINSGNVFYEVKRLIGRDFDDTAIKNLDKLLSYNIIKNERGKVSIKTDLLNNKILTPEEISAQILIKLKKMASNYLKCDVTDAVITVPANFSDAQREATLDAAEIAGLNCIRIINEPTAAALAYGILDKSIVSAEKEMRIIVYDFGGGTLDCTLMTIINGIFDVECSTGITHFGGVDFDNRLMTFCIAKFAKQNNYENFQTNYVSKLCIQKLRTQCEVAKKILSNSTIAHVMVNDFYESKNLFVKITRSEFENLCGDLFMLSMKCIVDIMDECNITSNDIDDVILIGGMTRIPYIRELLSHKFKTSDGKNKINCSINPDEAVATGAAIQGYILKNKSDDIFSNSITLLDITPLSLGVEVNGGCMDVVIKRNSTVPCEVTKMYSTDTDYADEVLIKVYEGERMMTKDNIKVGEFILKNIPKLTKGIPEIEITFAINSNGTIIVTAHETYNNEQQSIIVNSNKSRLTRGQINAMIHDARVNETNDEHEINRNNSRKYLLELCSNIIDNLKRGIKNENSNVFYNDVNNIIEWAEQTSMYSINEYLIKIDYVKKKYGTLILKCNENNTELSGISDEISATNVYDDNDDTKSTTNKGMTVDTISRINELKCTLNGLCDATLNVIYSHSTKLAREDKNNLIEQIDDILIWLHSCDNPTENDYLIKINIVNELCDKLTFETQSNSNEQDVNAKSILEEYCLAISVLIKNNIINDQNDMLLQKITSIFDVVYDTSKYLNEEEYKKIYDDLQNNCNDILQQLNEHNVNQIQHSEILMSHFNASKYFDKQNSFETPSTTSHNCKGTSIMDLLLNKQTNDINLML